MRLALAALALLLAGCGHATTVRVGRGQPVGVGFDAAVTTTVPARTTTTQRAGRDYRRPLETPKALIQKPKVLSGSALASWYGEGARTANGERFDPGALTFANKTMPFGTRVTFCHDGRCVTARCNDRGPAAWTGREFDLSRGAFQAIAPLGAGVISVSWEVTQ